MCTSSKASRAIIGTRGSQMIYGNASASIKKGLAVGQKSTVRTN